MLAWSAGFRYFMAGYTNPLFPGIDPALIDVGRFIIIWNFALNQFSKSSWPSLEGLAQKCRLPEL